MHYLHGDGVTTEGVENVGGSSEVENHRGWTRVFDILRLAVKERSYGEVPRSVSGHSESKERPDSIVMERRNENSCGTTSPKYVCPCPLVQFIINIIYIAGTSNELNNGSK